ncbi:MAG TPA: HEAT repeat domain-containing protein [Chloroflexota bacterium]|nr:HEAT repeat domain-containing protein [Chloroflexota bacterium]
MDEFRTVLDQILEGEDIPSGTWEHLSALADEREASFRGVWDSLTPSQRLGLLDSLHDESEQDAHLDFTPIWRLALDDPTPRVRVAAIAYSADEEGQWLVDPLLRLCASDPDASVRAAAAEALARFAYLAEVGELPARRGQEIEDLLLDTLNRPGEPLTVRGNALASVGYFSSSRVHDAIVAGHADADLRQSAVRAMGRNCDPGWTETLLADSMSKNAALREETARAIGEIEDERGVSRLLEMLDDPTVSVRLAAIWALGEIGGDEAQEALIYCLEDVREPVREAAEAALGEIAARADPLSL